MDQQILSHFSALPPQNRHAVYHGILDQLRRAEWREVKHRADRITFECDILGNENLPLEIVALIAEHLHLSDLIRLQRVSRKWHQVLSSSMVQNAAIRATLASGIYESDTKSVIRKRLRAERGQPAATMKLSSPLSSVHNYPNRPLNTNRALNVNNARNIGAMGYSNGIYAYIDALDDRTSISLTNLRTGKMDRLTTGNREPLIEHSISTLLIAAVSSRGYCHVWDLRTQEQKSFRISSLNYTHILINGLNLVVSYRSTIIHWGWESGIARTIQCPTCVFLLVPHPTEDSITMVRVGEEVYYGKSMVIADQECQMHVEQYAVDSDSNDFYCAHSQEQQFPMIESGELYDLFDPQELFKGQSSTILVRKSPSGDDSVKMCFSLQGNQIICHSFPAAPQAMWMACVGPDLIYIPTSEHGIVILDSTYKKSRAVLSTQDVGECQHSIQRGISLQRAIDVGPWYWVSGDSDFLVLVDYGVMEVWGFDDTWEPFSDQHPDRQAGVI
ncbi:hypothetical protein N7478_009108 [Penicillium angulare]|uniref:uncharacterized protein n=1 Tax=Penicillium angulare TaxID=116970 RepID=UPI0025404542|nr:uncharacterized protein N7478_009108 [Penicillium angulare]KAJ5273983.1 hypothetical protein N7478_009108 [Penicillium angulare]